MKCWEMNHNELVVCGQLLKIVDKYHKENPGKYIWAIQNNNTETTKFIRLYKKVNIGSGVMVRRVLDILKDQVIDGPSVELKRSEFESFRTTGKAHHFQGDL